MINQISFLDLFKKHRINSFDLLYIDTEGYDCHLVNNFLDIEICNKIINLMNNSEQIETNINVGNNVECFHVKYNLNEYIIKELNKKIYHILNIFSQFLNIRIIGSSDLLLRKVFGETILHMDGACIDITRHPYTNIELKSVRVLTLVGMLNDNYEGGIYNFPNQEISIKLKAGSIILFPPYWTHPHSVSKIITKTNELNYRYIYSCWALDDFLIIKKTDENINNIIILK
jgi:hypothetical protein